MDVHVFVFLIVFLYSLMFVGEKSMSILTANYNSLCQTSYPLIDKASYRVSLHLLVGAASLHLLVGAASPERISYLSLFRVRLAWEP